MKVKVQVVTITKDGQEVTREVGCLEREELTPVTLGLSLAEGKTLALCPRAWSTACERPVYQLGAGPHNEHCKRHADHEYVILEALTLTHHTYR